MCSTVTAPCSLAVCSRVLDNILKVSVQGSHWADAPASAVFAEFCVSMRCLTFLCAVAVPSVSSCFFCNVGNVVIFSAEVIWEGHQQGEGRREEPWIRRGSAPGARRAGIWHRARKMSSCRDWPSPRNILVAKTFWELLLPSPALPTTIIRFVL